MTAESMGSSGDAAQPARRVTRLLGCSLKRGLDVVGAILLGLVLVPVLVVAMAAVRLSSSGPVIFTQPRVGRDGRTFVMFKLRTMYKDCADQLHRDYVGRLLSGQVQPVEGIYKLPRDPRLTPVGAFLRRTSIDELPQLWNVLRGDMSLVGPRPALTWEVEMFPAWAAGRFTVRPGISGLSQVSGRNRLTMSEGLALDVRYVEEQCLLLDLKIMVRTIGAVFGGETR